MTPILLDPPPPPPTSPVGRDVRLGPLRFPTVEGQIKETLGDALETVGALAVPGERRPRPFSLTLPVHGVPADGSNILIEGDRLRAQVRALMENPRARLAGLWFDFAWDQVVSGWLLIGGADLSYTEQGVTFADYVLEMTDCYRIGDRNTHRPARRLESRDRRLSTTPRDYLGRVRSTDFASQAAITRHYLPVGASDAVGSGGAVFATTPAGTRDGNLAYVDSRPDKDTVTFEQSPSDELKGDVFVRDRRGAITAPIDGTDPLWDNVYGPAQQIAGGDVPVIDNGLARVRYVPDRAAFAFDSWHPTTGYYVEEGRATIWRDYPAGTETQAATLVHASLAEWTPERAVVKAILAIDAVNRFEVYITLQRGWRGPRIEVYGSWNSAGKPGVAVRITPSVANMTNIGASTGGLAWSNNTDFGPFGPIEPWMYLLPPAASAIDIAVLQGAVRAICRSGTAAYGAARNSVSFSAQYGSTAAGYVSVTLALGATRTTVAGDAQELGRLNLIDCRQTAGISAR
jgi:hypothetical protein